VSCTPVAIGVSAKCAPLGDLRIDELRFASTVFASSDAANTQGPDHCHRAASSTESHEHSARSAHATAAETCESRRATGQSERQGERQGECAARTSRQAP